MNRYTPDKNYILDAHDKPYAVDTPHPLPLPEGIVESDAFILFHSPLAKSGWNPFRLSNSTHWAAVRPIPVPRPKTLAEQDEEAFENYCSNPYPDKRAYFKQVWLAALDYERKRPKTDAMP